MCRQYTPLKRLAVAAAMLTMWGNGGQYTYEPPPTHPIIGTLVKVVHTPDGDVKVYRNELECLLTLDDVLMQAVDLETCND